MTTELTWETVNQALALRSTLDVRSTRLQAASSALSFHGAPTAAQEAIRKEISRLERLQTQLSNGWAKAGSGGPEEDLQLEHAIHVIEHQLQA